MVVSFLAVYVVFLVVVFVVLFLVVVVVVNVFCLEFEAILSVVVVQRLPTIEFNQDLEDAKAYFAADEGKLREIEEKKKEIMTRKARFLEQPERKSGLIDTNY